MSQTRTEHDSMGDVEVPADALWRAQTQRAIDNFPISGTTLERRHGIGDGPGRVGGGGRGLLLRGHRVARSQGLVTWMVTPSPRSRTAPGIRLTAMPGVSSSASRPGWARTVPFVEPRS